MSNYQDKNNNLDEENELQLIIGRNPVIEALKANKLIDTIYINPEAKGSITLICRLAKEKGINVKRVTETKLNNMSRGASHQGVIAMGACAEYVSPEDIISIANEKGEDPFIIICDEIEDPHNLGAIIRTAEAAGAHGVIIPKRRSASLNATVFKTSAGAASWLPVARVSNLAATIDMLKENGVWIYGTDGEGQSYTEVKLTGPIGLIVGSEGFGMGRLIKDKCDFLLSLPMAGKVNSLNASVAAGIFMYEAVSDIDSDGYDPIKATDFDDELASDHTNEKKRNEENAALINNLTKHKKGKAAKQSIPPVNRASLKDIKMGLTGKIIPKTEEFDKALIPDDATYEEKSSILSQHRKKKVDSFVLKTNEQESEPDSDDTNDKDKAGQTEFKKFDDA